jgi:hypothetical protein
VCPCIDSRMEDISLKMISPMTRVRHIIPVMPIPLDNVLLSEALVRLRMFEERLYLFSFSSCFIISSCGANISSHSSLVKFCELYSSLQGQGQSTTYCFI